MRNWNFWYSKKSAHLHVCFYPTYEELKLDIAIYDGHDVFCFYPTYEELK